MPKLPIIPSKELLKYLIKYGCIHVSTKSSHFKISYPATGKISVVPIHTGKDLGRGMLAAILKELDIDAVDFIKFLNKR
ncbi:MAG: type II toxin-antitoxin system HicA family toxin [Oscillospiraceae bacterium]|jgi:predicted RNA binding protein YcfA (HicA-like mRNA interferase family)|nr:type II toxin-antitoxin system HicA family toxin [Oscillospiraceae bacterium]